MTDSAPSSFFGNYYHASPYEGIATSFLRGGYPLAESHRAPPSSAHSNPVCSPYQS